MYAICTPVDDDEKSIWAIEEYVPLFTRIASNRCIGTQIKKLQMFI